MVGFKYAYQNPTKLNGFIGDFNSTLTGGENALPEQHWLPGLSLGARYRLGMVRFELHYANMFNSRVARERNVSGDMVRSKVLFTRQADYSLAMVSQFGGLGVGTSLELINYKTTFEDFSVNLPKFSSDSYAWGSQFFLNIEASSDGQTGIILRPYVQLMWTDVDLFPLANRLNADLHSDPTAANYGLKFTNFGLALIVCNGPQED